MCFSKEMRDEDATIIDTHAAFTVRRPTVMIVLALMAALALRFVALGDDSLWMDEGFTWLVARAPVTEVVSMTERIERAPPLSYLVVHGFLQLSEGEVAVRAASALSGVLAVAASIWLGWVAFGLREGVLAGLLLAVSALHVMMSRDARAYSMAALLITLSSGFWLCELRNPGRRGPLAAYVVSTLLAIYTHYVCLFIVGLQVLTGLLRWQPAARSLGRTVLGPRVLAWGVVLLAYLPWVPALLAQQTRGSSGFVPVVKLYASATSLPDALFVQAVGFFLNLPSIWLWYAVAALAGGLMVLPAALDGGLAARFLATVCGGAIGTLIVVSLPHGLGLYSAKYLVLVSPVFWVLVARSATLTAERGLRVAGLLVVAAPLLLNLVSTANLLTLDEWHNQDWRGAVQAVAAKGRADDVALLVPIYATPVTEYYWTRFSPQPRFAGLDAARVNALSAADLASASRIWLIEGDPSMVDPQGRVEQLLDATRSRLAGWASYRRNPSLRVRVTLFGAPR